MPKYRVFCPEWHDEDEAVEVVSFDPADACKDWCQIKDSHSAFADGYPQGLTLTVICCDESRSDYEVETEFIPEFWATRKAVEKAEEER